MYESSELRKVQVSRDHQYTQTVSLTGRDQPVIYDKAKEVKLTITSLNFSFRHLSVLLYWSSLTRYLFLFNQLIYVRLLNQKHIYGPETVHFKYRMQNWNEITMNPYVLFENAYTFKYREYLSITEKKRTSTGIRNSYT